jgi:predicted dehydrogenase
MADKKLTKQSIGVGVAGTGFIGPAHIEGLRRNGIQVLGLAEQSKETAQQKAAELGVPRSYGSLDEMLVG